MILDTILVIVHVDTKKSTYNICVITFVGKFLSLVPGLSIFLPALQRSVATTCWACLAAAGAWTRETRPDPGTATPRYTSFPVKLVFFCLETPRVVFI